MGFVDDKRPGLRMRARLLMACDQSGQDNRPPIGVDARTSERQIAVNGDSAQMLAQMGSNRAVLVFRDDIHRVSWEVQEADAWRQIWASPHVYSAVPEVRFADLNEGWSHPCSRTSSYSTRPRPLRRLRDPSARRHGCGCCLSLSQVAMALSPIGGCRTSGRG